MTKTIMKQEGLIFLGTNLWEFHETKDHASSVNNCGIQTVKEKRKWLWHTWQSGAATLTTKILFLNGPTPASISFIFGLFKQTIQFLQQICEQLSKFPSSIRCWESNPQPFEH